MHVAQVVIVVIVLLLSPAATQAQQIRGVVVDDSTDVPIADATVKLLAEDSTIRAVTRAASNGWFQIPTGSPGRFFLHVAHPVYAASGSLEVVVANQEIVTVVVRMSGGPIPLAPLVVTARSHDRLAGFRNRVNRGGLGRYLLRDEIEKRPAARVSDLLRFAPEVVFEPIRDGALTGSGIFMRSLGDLCVPAIYLDGIPVSGADAFGIDVNDLLSPELIEGIEIYRSYVTAPLEFHIPRNTCGVVAFWSRSIRGKSIGWKHIVLAGLIAGAMVVFAR